MFKYTPPNVKLRTAKKMKLGNCALLLRQISKYQIKCKMEEFSTVRCIPSSIEIHSNTITYLTALKSIFPSLATPKTLDLIVTIYLRITFTK